MISYTVVPPTEYVDYRQFPMSRLLREAVTGAFSRAAAAFIALFHILCAAGLVIYGWVRLIQNQGVWPAELHRSIVVRIRYAARTLDYIWSLNNAFPPARLHSEQHPSNLSIPIPPQIPPRRLLLRFLDGLPHLLAFFIYGCLSWAIVPIILGAASWLALYGWTSTRYAAVVTHNYYLLSGYAYFLALTEDYPPAPWEYWNLLMAKARDAGLPETQEGLTKK